MSSNLALVLGSLCCGGIFASALAALGIFLIVSSARARKKTAASQGWPSTTGQVTISEVKQSTSTDDDGNTSYGYYPHIEYTYQVAGQTYSSRRFIFGAYKGYKDHSKAAADAGRYPLGAQVTVYYDPAKPSEAVLERKAGSSTAMTVGGIVCLVIGACMTCPLLVAVIRELSNLM